MFSHKKIIITVLFLVCLIMPVKAKTTLSKRTGEVFIGKLVEFENNVVTIKTKDGFKKILFTELNPKSQYIVKSHFSNPDCALEHLELSQFCLNNKFYGESIIESTLSGELTERVSEKAFKTLKQARFSYSNSEIKKAEKLIRAKFLLEALKIYNKIYSEYPEIENREQIKKKIFDLQRIIGRKQVPPIVMPLPSLLQKFKEKNNPKNNKVVKQPKLSSKDQREYNKFHNKIEDAKQPFNEGVKLFTAARSNEMNREKNYKQAYNKFVLALAKLKKAEIPNKSFLLELGLKAKRFMNEIQDNIVELARDLMNYYIGINPKKPDIVNSLKWLNLLLAYSPYDREAKELRALITKKILQNDK